MNVLERAPKQWLVTLYRWLFLLLLHLKRFFSPQLFFVYLGVVGFFSFLILIFFCLQQGKQFQSLSTVSVCFFLYCASRQNFPKIVCPAYSSGWLTAGCRGWGISGSKSTCSNKSYFFFPTPSVPITWTPQRPQKIKSAAESIHSSHLFWKLILQTVFCQLHFQK